MKTEHLNSPAKAGSKPSFLILAAIAAGTVLFFLILLAARLATPAEIPSVYYADDGFFAFGFQNIRGLVFLYFLILIFSLAAVLYYEPVTGFLKRKRGEDAEGFLTLLTALLAFALGSAGAVLLFVFTGAAVREFWVTAAGIVTALSAVQIRLLLAGRKDEAALKGVNKAFPAFLSAVIVLIILLLFECLETRNTAPSLYGQRRFMLPFALILAETILLALLYNKYILKRKESAVCYRRVYLFLFLLAAAGYLLVFLPFVAPDEDLHYLSAYRLADLFLGKLGRWGDARLIMRQEDWHFYQGMQRYISSDYYISFMEKWHLFAREPGYIVIGANMGTNALPGYIPAALGIVIARVLHLGGNAAFLAARLMNILFLAAVLNALMKKIPGRAAALFAAAMLPMTLHLSASCSYDIPIFCLAALYIAQVAEIAAGKEPGSGKAYFKCLLYAFLLAPSKLVYMPLLFLSLFIPRRALSENRPAGILKKWLPAAAGFAGILFFSAGSSSIYVHSALGKLSGAGTLDSALSAAGPGKYTAVSLLKDLPDTVMMFLRTLTQMADYYFLTLFGQKLGWLRIEIPGLCAVVCFVLFLIALHLRDDDSRKLPRGAGIFAAVLAAGVILAVFLGMTLSSTEAGSTVIEGIQGRYFLPLILLPVFVWTGALSDIKVEAGFRKKLVLLLPVIHLWILNFVYARHFFS